MNASRLKACSIADPPTDPNKDAPDILRGVFLCGLRQVIQAQKTLKVMVVSERSILGITRRCSLIYLPTSASEGI